LQYFEKVVFDVVYYSSFRTTWVTGTRKAEPFWILLKQEMMRWQWHQLDHTQINCTLFQTDNDTSTLLLSF